MLFIIIIIFMFVCLIVLIIGRLYSQKYSFKSSDANLLCLKVSSSDVRLSFWNEDLDLLDFIPEEGSTLFFLLLFTNEAEDDEDELDEDADDEYI